MLEYARMSEYAGMCKNMYEYARTASPEGASSAPLQRIRPPTAIWWIHLESSTIMWNPLEAWRGIWSNPEPPGVLKNYWELSVIIWTHLEALESSGGIWSHLEYLESSGTAWNHLEASGVIQRHLDSAAIIWSHLKSSAGIWRHLEASVRIRYSIYTYMYIYMYICI